MRQATWKSLRYAYLVAAISLVQIGSAAADEPQDKAESDKTVMNPKFNIPTWTLGGKQFWTDTMIHGKWRIQRHVLSGHCRLLDPSNIRRAWGTYDECLSAWNRQKKENRIEPLARKVVIVIHGLGRSRSSMNSMVRYLRDNSDYSVLSFSYASTRATLAEDAQLPG